MRLGTVLVVLTVLAVLPVLPVLAGWCGRGEPFRTIDSRPNSRRRTKKEHADDLNGLGRNAGARAQAR